MKLMGGCFAAGYAVMPSPSSAGVLRISLCVVPLSWLFSLDTSDLLWRDSSFWPFLSLLDIGALSVSRCV